MTNGVVETGDWTVLGGDAARISRRVFVREQQIPPEWELDDDDPLSLHAVAYRVDAATGARRAVATGGCCRPARSAASRCWPMRAGRASDQRC